MENTDYQKELKTPKGAFTFYDITRLEKDGIADIKRLPYSIKILVENLLRRLDGRIVLDKDLENIARLLNAVDRNIPFTLLAFFPEYKMKDFASPNVAQMVEAYQRVKAVGLTNVRLGNVGVFARSAEDQAYLTENVDPDAF